MKWYRALFIGDGIKLERKKLIRKIETNAGLKDTYMITLASNERDLLDIFSTKMLMQPVLHGLCPVIIGIAKGYDEAVELACEIVMSAYQKNQNFDVRSYLRERTDADGEWYVEYPMERLKKRSFGFWNKRTAGE